MTVQELMEVLKSLPADAQVTFNFMYDNAEIEIQPEHPYDMGMRGTEDGRIFLHFGMDKQCYELSVDYKRPAFLPECSQCHQIKPAKHIKNNVCSKCRNAEVK